MIVAVTSSKPQHIMTNRKFYKTIFQVEVLSEEPIKELSLSDLDYEITEGDCSGRVSTLSENTINGACAANELLAQGSDPSFFGLTEDGNDCDL